MKQASCLHTYTCLAPEDVFDVQAPHAVAQEMIQKQGGLPCEGGGVPGSWCLDCAWGRHDERGEHPCRACADSSRQVEALKAQLQEVYVDRNLTAQLAAFLAIKYEMRAGVSADPQQPGWPVLSIDLPLEGQVSWHINPQDLIQPWPRFHLHGRRVQGEWDGHTPKDKLERMRGYLNRRLGSLKVGQ